MSFYAFPCRQLVEQGPSHLRTFVWECRFHTLVAQGQGRSKKEAKTAAAKAVKVRLDPATLPDGPSYQEAMEKKRKREEEKAAAKKRAEEEAAAAGPPGEGPGPSMEKAPDSSQAKHKKYDYKKHIEQQQQRQQRQQQEAFMYMQFRNGECNRSE